ncbi:hypothetical protein D4R20_00765 [bacterium]|nr:MAG: hypothetical protein D4R20_00765 [bacterium]
METLTSNKIICPQCAGENEIQTDDKFVTCSFCGSAIFVDKSKIVNHYVVVPNFNKEQAEGNLRRWMAGNFQSKNLDRDSKISAEYFYYFPLWYFKTQEGAGDKIYLQPAYSTSVSEIKNIQIPAGNLKPFNAKEVDIKEFISPDVLYDSAKAWLEQSGVNSESVSESNLVHIPFFQFYYNYKGSQYTAMVEASSGKVYANHWPAKSEIPFKLLFALSIITFIVASIVSLGAAYVLDERPVLLYGEFFKIFLYGLATIPLVLLAYIIAKKA